MKATFVTLLLVVCAWAGRLTPAAGAPADVSSFSLSGKDYVRLADWARANSFEISWLKRDESVQLNNRSAHLVFGADSREAEVNGVNVWLSYPVVVRNGAAFVAKLDLKTVIQPVLAPPHNRSGLKVRTIVIDPGHGGKDPGNQDGAHQEKRYTLLLAQELGDQLKRAGFKATLTRTTDTLIDLPYRPEIARRRGADLFISLHFNSTSVGKSEVKGAETYCLTPTGASSTNARGEIGDAGFKPGNFYDDKNMFLAYVIQRSLQKNLSVEDRGVRRARFAVLRTAEMPAVLIEGGFMSHPTESKRIYDSVYRRQMASAIVQAVQAYKTQVEQSKNAEKGKGTD